MPKQIIVASTAIAMLLLFYVSPLGAGDIDELSRTELKDKWGQLLFCQTIYKLPEVKPRLYDFDNEQCDTAAQLIGDLVSNYPPGDQQELKFQAEKHAIALSYHTSEPYHSVPACRQYCRTLSAIQDKRKGRVSDD